MNLEAIAREYGQTKVGGKNIYCSYVDASIAIDRNATGQRVYEDEISTKGVHTMNYTEAAREAYGDIGKEISKLLKDSLDL